MRPTATTGYASSGNEYILNGGGSKISLSDNKVSKKNDG